MVQPRQHRRLAQELLACLLEQIHRKAAIVLDFLERTLAAFQAQVIGQVDAPHPSLADNAGDLVTTT